MLTNLGLVEHAKRALKEGWGYVLGTYGLVLTEALLEQKIKQYPEQIAPYKDFIKANWIGKRTADCVGLIKSYVWWDESKNNPVYDSRTDINETTMFNMASEKGPISEMPDIPGICVWRPGHIGIYIGNDLVIEAKGTKYGVVQTALKSGPWTHWLKCPFVQYIEKGPAPEHWAEKFYRYLVEEKGIEITEKRFDDKATRGELFAMCAKILGYKD